ncbi:uncharacterized protein LOC134271533 [Saccostrea cucullata]|uniref:uncharacterized protein LOC134271533 n=1 Tax=Saccostrea cuccullata TaxID=36930 RepID=UPI002ED3D5EE
MELFLVFNIVFYIQSVTCACPRSKGKECCFGHYWDKTYRICKECESGYFGEDCSQICSYPNYGTECQYLCNCSPKFCSPFTGCVLPTETYIYDHPSTSPRLSSHTQEEISTKANTADENMDFSVFYLTLITVLGLIGVFVLILTVYVTIQIRNKCSRNKMKRNISKQSNKSRNSESESYESLQSINMIPLNQVSDEMETYKQPGNSNHLSNEQSDTEKEKQDVNACYLAPQISPNIAMEDNDQQITKPAEETESTSKHELYLTVIG